MLNRKNIAGLLFISLYIIGFTNAQGLKLISSFSGNLAPKSVVHNGNGLFFAQNMMYEHSITVYNRNDGLIHTLSDSIRLSEFGFSRFKDTVVGAPCEAAFSHNGKYVWIANYAMYGNGFDSIANDDCTPNGGYDSSYIFKISTKDFKVKNVIQVGCVPKFLQVFKDSLLLVSNWCSGNVSVVSLATERVIKTYDVKMYPRGIAFDPYSNTAFIAQMGTYEIARINLSTHLFDSIVVPGRSPRHLCIDPIKRILYATLNGSGLVAKIDLETDSTVKTVATGKAPRSMVLTADGAYLYVVNYFSNTVSKVRTTDMKVLESIPTEPKPIGITFDDATKHVWVSCYEGFVQKFEDSFYGVDSLYESLVSNHRYGLVLGSFFSLTNAQNLLKNLADNNIEAQIIENDNTHRVVYCNYNSVEDALAAQEKYKVLTNSWVLKCAFDE